MTTFPFPTPADTAIPTLTTARLTLGAPTTGQFEAWAEFVASDRARFFGGPAAEGDAWRGMAMQLGHWSLRGYGAFWLRETATGTPVGRVGVWHPLDWPEPELAWLVYAPFEGTGMAQEAARAVRDWAARDRGLGPLVSLIAPDNLPSQRLAARLGAVHEGDGAYPDGGACQVWRHPEGAR